MAKTEEEVKAEAAAKAAEEAKAAETAEEAKAEASEEESTEETSEETKEESTETETAKATEGEEAAEEAPAEEAKEDAPAESAEASEEKTEEKADEAAASEGEEEAPAEEAAPEATEEAAEEAPAEEKAEASEDKTDEAEALAEAAAASKAAFDKKMKDKLACGMASNDIEAFGFELNDKEKALASEKSFAEIVKMAIALSSELEEVHAAKAAAEASANGEARYKELAEKGLAFVGEKATVQKEKVGKMEDAAFASYVDDLVEIKGSLGSDDGFDKEELEKAKANVGNLSQQADAHEESLQEKYAKLKA